MPAGYRTPFIPEHYLSSWAQYSILLGSYKEREGVIIKLKEQNIPTMIYYKIPLHLQEVFDYLGYKVSDFPVSEKIARNILSIPMHPYLETSEQDKILKTLYEAL